MNDDRISAALESLPREEAGTDFTAGVLRRLEERPRRLFTARWAMAAAAAAIVVLALGFGWREWRHQQQRRQAVAQLEMLLAEKQELEAELRSLRRLSSRARPVVYLGGNENVDLVLDLARLRSRGGWPANLEAPRNADLRPGNRPETRRAVY